MEAINVIRQDVSTALHNLVRVRLGNGQLQNWLAAFDESGRGSASRRALRMKRIYEDAAPVPGVIITEAASQFDDVRELVHSAIEPADADRTSASSSIHPRTDGTGTHAAAREFACHARRTQAAVPNGVGCCPGRT